MNQKEAKEIAMVPLCNLKEREITEKSSITIALPRELLAHVQVGGSLW
jgi:hypothetical protein